MSQTILIFGQGYVSKALLTQFKNNQVYLTSRNKNNLNSQTIDFNNFEKIKTILKQEPIIISTVPPQQDQDPVLSKYLDLIESNNIKCCIYLSSTSVYGNHAGNWVNETSPCNPTYPQDIIRLKVENSWAKLTKKTIIFRIAGIYGPNRNCLEQIQNGKDYTIFKQNQFFSRIHIADICQSISKAIQVDNQQQNNIYNLADNLPTPLHIKQQFAAKLLSLPTLKQIDYAHSQLSENVAKFFTQNKKVCNKKLLKELNINLIFPTYQEGLQYGCLPYLRTKA